MPGENESGQKHISSREHQLCYNGTNNILFAKESKLLNGFGSGIRLGCSQASVIYI